MAASMKVILNIFKPPQLPDFLADFEQSCIKVKGLLSTLLQDILTAYITAYIAFPFILVSERYLNEKIYLMFAFCPLITLVWGFLVENLDKDR